MADNKITFDLDALEKQSHTTVEEIPQAATGAPQERVGALGFIKTVADEDFIVSNVARTVADANAFEVGDFDFAKEVPQAVFEEETKDFPKEVTEGIAENSRSLTHFHMLVNEYRRTLENEEKIAAYGGWGVAGRIGGNLLDPTNYITGFSGGVLSVGTKAERLAQAAKAATTAAGKREVLATTETALKTGHTSNVLRGALYAGAENGALEALGNSNRNDRDGWDLLYATGAGFAFGGVGGRMFSGAERAEFRAMANDLKRDAQMLELDEAIAQQRRSLTSTLGDVNAARAEVDTAIGKSVVFLSERDADLGDYASFRRVLESNGNPNAKAGSSSASGADQFLGSTWLGIVKQTKPKWAEGLDDEALLKLRFDAGKSGEMAAALDAQNAKALRGANAPVNHFTLYAAHHFGPNKGVVFALAKAETKMEDILTKAQLDANPYLKGLTKEQAMANWAKRARKGGVDLGAMIDKAPASAAEARRMEQLKGFDRPAAEARLGELDAQLKAHEEAVAKHTADAAGALSSGEMRKLRREVDSLTSELNGRKGTPVAKLKAKVDELDAKIADLTGPARERRLKAAHAEDELKLGPDVANNKQRTKLREAHVDHTIRTQKKTLDRLRGEADHAHRTARYSLKERLQGMAPRLAGGERAVSAKALLKALEGDAAPRAAKGEADGLRAALGLNTKLAGEAAADAARKADVQAHLKVVKGKADDLDKLDALDTVESANQVRKQSIAEGRGDFTSTSPETLSAAKVVGFDEGLFPHVEDTVGGAELSKMKMGGMMNLYGKGTFSGVFRGSDNAVVRRELGPLVGNALGNVDDSVDQIGASEIMSTILKAKAGKFHAAIETSYPQWRKEKGYGRIRGMSRNIRGEFMREVGLHIRGQEAESAASKAAAARISAVFREFLDEAKAAGVKGFENVEANEHYLPRVFDFHAFHALNNKVGADNLGTLIAKGIQQQYPHLDDATAKKIGDAYIKRMRELRVGNDAGLMQGMSFDDVHFLRTFLGDAGLDSGDIEEVVKKFANATRPDPKVSAPLLKEMRKLKERTKVLKERKKTRAQLGKESPKADKSLAEIATRMDEIKKELEASASSPDAKAVMDQEGGFRHAKMRQKFDENFSMRLQLKDTVDTTDPANFVEVRISELFENNVEALFGRYSRTMAGHIGLAKVGIKSAGDFKLRMERVTRALENDEAQLKNVQKMGQAAYDILTARPLEDAGLMSELMRTGRDLAYASQMENAGLANIPDIASLLSYGNFRYSAEAFFSGDVFGALWRRGDDHRMVDGVMQELEETTGIGTDHLNNAVYSSYDVSDQYAEALVDGKALPRMLSTGFSNVAHGARVVGRGVTTGSGLAAITSGAQRLAARNMVYRIKDDVLKGGRLSDARSAALGLSPDLKKRIAEQFKKHTEFKVQGEYGKIDRVNFHKWDDHDARDAFLYAINREARKNIQEEDLGDTLLWQHKGMGKVLIQFRRFGITAYTKQLARGIAEKDAETATRVLLQTTLAGGVYALRHQMVVAGMEAAGIDSDKIEKYKEDNLSPLRIGAAAVRNSGWASLFPDAYDSTVGNATGVPLFDVRNSGNKSGLIQGIPLVGLTQNIGNAAASTWQAILRGDRQFDQQDARAWQALVPFGNHLLVSPAIQALTAHLPERDDDADTETAQWFWQ